MFCQEHNGKMPGRGGAGKPSIFDSTGAVAEGNPATDYKNAIDWIAWQRVKDPVTGAPIPGWDQNITYSALAPYLGVKYQTHANADEANRISPKLEEVFRCPSDNLVQRNNAGSVPYRYSYSMNDYVASPEKFGTRVRSDFIWTGKLSSVHHPAEKLLFIDEDEKTIDDGVFRSNPQNWGTGSVNAIAARHELKNKKARGGTWTGDGNITEDARGNATFCDGHGELFSRKDGIRQRHTGSPTADPPGF
jgi:prepilin-type processing-associated H-X9-DG protein